MRATSSGAVCIRLLRAVTNAASRACLLYWKSFKLLHFASLTQTYLVCNPLSQAPTGERLHQVHLSTATLHKVLSEASIQPIVTYRLKKDFQRYERTIPDDRVQVDTCKIAPGVYQYTAIVDCSRYWVLRCYSRRTAANTIDFIECVVEDMPFPIQRIQRARGREFFVETAQKQLMTYGIKFRPNKPGSPHLNGKVERSQKTDKSEFYPTLDVSVGLKELDLLLAEWQHYYNLERPHSSLKGLTPIDRITEVSDQTPLSEEVSQHY